MPRWWKDGPCDILLPVKLILLISALLSLSTTARAFELKGTVKSEDGKPLAGVQISTYAPAGPAKILGMQVQSSTKHYEITTGADGSFKLPGHGRLVYFHRVDLRPLTKIIELTATQLDIIMEDGSRSLWKIPACSAQEKSTRVGVGFMVNVPKSVIVKDAKDRFEDGGYLFGHQVGERVEILVNWWESSSLEPLEKYLLESDQFSQRMWTSGDKWGYEFRGTLPNGKVWRRIAMKNGAIAYQENSKEAATVFDSMLDAVCFDESAVKW